MIGFLWFVLALANTVIGQTYTHCNPLHEHCEPNPALGRRIHMDFARDGPSGSMTRTGSATIIYDDNDGALFTISGSGHNPTLQSKFYIMFGKVSVVARAASGAGVVSSIVLQSDDLDEIDVEFVGNDPNHMQSNYFGKGDTSTYDRGQYHLVPGRSATTEYHTYTIEWTADAIRWYIDDQLVRALHSADRPDIYPQTPMNVHVGAWAAGDAAYNQEGTIEWAGGLIDYAAGPFTYGVQSVDVEDYSTGTNYEYTDQSGTWTSIKAHNGQVGPTGPASKGWFRNFLKIAKPM